MGFVLLNAYFLIVEVTHSFFGNFRREDSNLDLVRIFLINDFVKGIEDPVIVKHALNDLDLVCLLNVRLI